MYNLSEQLYFRIPNLRLQSIHLNLCEYTHIGTYFFITYHIQVILEPLPVFVFINYNNQTLPLKSSTLPTVSKSRHIRTEPQHRTKHHFIKLPQVL